MIHAQSICLLEACLFGLLMVGCAPEYENRVFALHHSIMTRQQKAHLDGEEPHYKASELDALLGDPEHVLSVHDFIGLLDEQCPLQSRAFRTGLDIRLSQYLKTATSPSGTSLPAQVAQCEVRLYRWKRPAQVRLHVSGGTIFLVPRSFTQQMSFVYVLYDSTLVHFAALDRGQCQPAH